MGAARFLLGPFVLAVAAAIGAPAQAACPAASPTKDWVPAGALCLASATFGEPAAGNPPVLVVLLHGDTSSGGPADYLFDFAREIAKPGVVAVALLRPGYGDRKGRTSQGNDLGRRDNYTPEYVGAVGSAIEFLRKEHRAQRVVLVGHSGGSAMTGILLGKRPGIASDAILVSCPCDIVQWRQQRGGGAWTRSESPSTYAAKIPASTRLVTITGDGDDNTRPQLAAAYVAVLAKRGVAARHQTVAGAGHNFTRPLQEATLAALKEMLGR